MDHGTLMDRALDEARKALKRGDFPVGCIITDSAGTILATGRRLGSTDATLTELDHAEIVALRNLRDTGCTLPGEALTVYSTMEPCLMCHATLLLNDIGTVVWAYEDIMGGGTMLPVEHLPPLYGRKKTRVIGGIRRTESLALFQHFFADPNQDYWRDSPLARYTLDQPRPGTTAS